jgi:hypothetical protein
VCIHDNVNSNIKLSLSLIKHHAMNADWQSGGIFHTFLASAQDGGERTA